MRMMLMMMQIMMMRMKKKKKKKENKKLVMMMMLLLVRHTDDDIEAIVFVYRKARRKDGPIRSLCYHRDKYIVPPAVHDMYRHLCRLAASHTIPFKLPHYESVALFVISLAVRLF